MSGAYSLQIRSVNGGNFVRGERATGSDQQMESIADPRLSPPTEYQMDLQPTSRLSPWWSMGEVYTDGAQGHERPDEGASARR